MFKHDLYAFLNFAMYVGLSITSLAIFIKLFVLCTPHDNVQKVREGDISHAITLGGVAIGFTIPLLACSYLGASVVSFIELAVIIGLFQLILEKALDAYLLEDNIATSVFHACLSVCLGLITAFSIIP